MTINVNATPPAKLDVTDRASVETFIRSNTMIMAPPLVREVKLHLAEESFAIWHKTEDELGQLNLPPPFWAFAWAGGQALARYVLDNPEIVRDARVLDLGCGSGLVSIAARLAGAHSVVAADVDPLALISTNMNAVINQVRIKTTDHNYLSATSASPDELGKFDVILVGDLFYERPVAECLMAAIKLADANKTPVFSGDPQRSYFPRTQFREVASYEVRVTRELEDAEIKSVGVWRYESNGPDTNE